MCIYSGTCESCYIRSCMMYMSPGEEHHTPDSISEDTTSPQELTLMNTGLDGLLCCAESTVSVF